jgi:hypothetical protein
MFKQAMQAMQANDLDAARAILRSDGNIIRVYRDRKGRSFLHLLMSMSHANPAWIAFLVDECEVPLWGPPHPHPVLHRADFGDNLRRWHEMTERSALPRVARLGYLEGQFELVRRGRLAGAGRGSSITWDYLTYWGWSFEDFTRFILFEAILEQDDKLLQRCFAEVELSPHLTNDHGDTALHYLFDCSFPETPESKGFDNVEMLKFLLAQGGDPASRNKDGDTVLHVALAHQHRHSADYLVSHFPQLVNLANNYGDFPVRSVCDDPYSDSLFYEILTRQKVRDRQDFGLILLYQCFKGYLADLLKFRGDLLWASRVSEHYRKKARFLVEDYGVNPLFSRRGDNPLQSLCQGGPGLGPSTITRLMLPFMDELISLWERTVHPAIPAAAPIAAQTEWQHLPWACAQPIDCKVYEAVEYLVAEAPHDAALVELVCRAAIAQTHTSLAVGCQTFWGLVADGDMRNASARTEWAENYDWRQSLRAVWMGAVVRADLPFYAGKSAVTV